jgi:Mor family transcriptional regulator
MMDFIKDIAAEELTEDQRKIIELIGTDAYSKLVEAFGGTTVYIHKKDGFSRTVRNEEIRKKFDGGNYKQLALEYCLTEVAIRQIVAKIDEEMKTRQIDGQEDLFMANSENEHGQVM